MASLDIYRPAAQEQLLTLGADNTIAVLPKQDKKPLEIAKIAKSMQRIKTLMFSF